MTEKNDCIICGKELMYFEKPKKVTCVYCDNTFETTVTCVNDHYVCDSCHRSDADDLIEKTCIQSEETDPFKIAETLMKHPTVHMHGPEHHFLVPAVLLASYYNTQHKFSEKKEKIHLARKRSELIKGGFCGTHGVCGAAVGTGIFVSIITQSTPLSTEEWKLSNLVTAQSLKSIAQHGGPRCCKRNTFLALFTALDFLKNHFQIHISHQKEKKCYFSPLNKECIQQACPYYSTKK